MICFTFYVFYLFKRSEDLKKEKTLQVADPKVQKVAADKILSDYPDIEIDKIRDTAGAIELAKKIIDDKLAKYNKTMNTLLIFCIIFAITFLISLLIPKYSYINDSEPVKPVSNWAQTEATKASYPYATLSIVQHIKIRDIFAADSSKRRVAEFRNHYTILALKDIKSSAPIFEEQFLSTSAEIKSWPGSELQEVESITDGRYWVKFELNKNQTTTVVTGANYFYSVPLQKSSGTNCFGDILKSNNEWMTCYPNSTDYIDNVTVIIEAEGIGIRLPPVATYRKVKEGNIVQGEGSCKIFSDNDNCTLVAKWSKISPGECVGFKINWELPRL